MIKKISESDKIRANNLIEEASDMVSSCINCGLCKSNSSVFSAIKEESLSPRGLANLLKNKTMSEDFFKSNLDGSCKKVCPMKIDIDEATLKVREAMFLLGKSSTPSKNKKRAN